MNSLQIVSAISQWMAERTNNSIEPGSDSAAFDPPLIGIACGDDSLFVHIADDIGSDFYWSPVDAFQHAYPSEKAEPAELSVIAWILPQTEETRMAHRKEKNLPSIEWSKVRLYGEQVNENLRKYMVSYFNEHGYQSCSPVLLPEWRRHVSEKYGFASSWSERHTAYVCGLGTFGLSDGLITSAGKAVRVGSVIVRLHCEPTTRAYSGHNDYCLYHTTGKCMLCVKRCPVSAISKKGHDKKKCKQYIRETTAQYVEKHQLGVKVNSCGLCQVGVPCEKRIPVRKK